MKRVVFRGVKSTRFFGISLLRGDAQYCRGWLQVLVHRTGAITCSRRILGYKLLAYLGKWGYNPYKWSHNLYLYMKLKLTDTAGLWKK